MEKHAPTLTTAIDAARARSANAMLRADFIDTLQRLEARVAALGDAIVEDDDGLWAWSYRGEHEPPRTSINDERMRIAADLARLDHSDSDMQRLRTPAGADTDENDGRSTILITALAAASAPTLALAAEVNTLKDRLDQVMRAMDKARLTQQDLLEAKPHWVGARLLRYQLHVMPRRRLSWHQAVRRIQIETQTPAYAAFFWAALPLRYRTTGEALRRRLSRLSDLDDHPAAVDLARLETLKQPLRDTDEIIIERPAHLHPRCNLSFYVAADGHRRRITRVRRAIMPILYPADPNNPALDLRRALTAYQGPPEPKKQASRPYLRPPATGQRRQRSDAAIGPWIPLESVTAYRALPRKGADPRCGKPTSDGH